MFAPPLIGIFSSDPEVVPYGVRCLRIVAAGFLFYGYGMVLTQSFNGAGDTRTPTLINLVCLWAARAPAGVGAGVPAGLRPDRRVRRGQPRVLGPRGRERRALPARRWKTAHV